MSYEQQIEALQNNLVLHKNALWKACGDDEECVNATLESQDDCAPNHFCKGKLVHLPAGEQCDKCGEST